MKTLLTIGLALSGIIFMGCHSQKNSIKSQSEFQEEQNSFFKDGDFTNFFIYTLGSIGLGLLAVFLGFFLSKNF